MCLLFIFLQLPCLCFISFCFCVFFTFLLLFSLVLFSRPSLLSLLPFYVSAFGSFFSLSFPLLLPPLSSHALPFSPPFCPFFALPSHLFVILSPLYTVGPWLSAYVVWVLSHKTPDPYSMHLMSLMAALNSTFLCLFENDGETKHRCNLCLCLLGEKTPPAKTWHDYSFCLCLLKKATAVARVRIQQSVPCIRNSVGERCCALLSSPSRQPETKHDRPLFSPNSSASCLD